MVSQPIRASQYLRFRENVCIASYFCSPNLSQCDVRNRIFEKNDKAKRLQPPPSTALAAYKIQPCEKSFILRFLQCDLEDATFSG